jgi:hypothetical protein
MVAKGGVIVKRKILLLALLIFVLSVGLLLSGCGTDDPPGITYALPYRLEGSVGGSGAKGGALVTREYVARKIYYTTYGTVSYGIQMRMVDANGLDLPNPVWGEVDPEILAFDAQIAPNKVMFQPLKPGTTVVTATQDGYEAKATVVVLMTHRVGLKEPFDFDGDGIEDFIKRDAQTFTFLYGATKTDLMPTPEYLDDVPDDYPAPAVEEKTFEIGTRSPMIAVFNASDGSVFAGVVWVDTERNTFAFRKLR